MHQVSALRRSTYRIHFMRAELTWSSSHAASILKIHWGSFASWISRSVQPHYTTSKIINPFLESCRWHLPTETSVGVLKISNLADLSCPHSTRGRWLNLSSRHGGNRQARYLTQVITLRRIPTWFLVLLVRRSVHMVGSTRMPCYNL